MARQMGRLYNRIWRDQEFLDRTIGAKLLFALLLSQDNISAAGVLPLQHRLWAKLLGDGAKPDDVLAWLGELQDVPSRPFVVLDPDTEEVLVRTLIRNDKMPQGTPKVQAPAIEACAVVRSSTLRDWLAGELDLCLGLGLVHASLELKVVGLIATLSPAPSPPDSQCDSQSDSQCDWQSDSQGEWLSRGLSTSTSPSQSPSDARANENDDPPADLVEAEADPSDDRSLCRVDGCTNPATKPDGRCGQCTAMNRGAI
jgi:hypothetical protein